MGDAAGGFYTRGAGLEETVIAPLSLCFTRLTSLRDRPLAASPKPARYYYYFYGMWGDGSCADMDGRPAPPWLLLSLALLPPATPQPFLRSDWEGLLGWSWILGRKHGPWHGAAT